MHKPLLRLEAKVPQGTTSLGKGWIIGDDHPPFAGGDVLVGVEAEGADLADYWAEQLVSVVQQYLAV